MTTAAPFAHCESVFFTRLRGLGYDARVFFDIGSAQCGWSNTIAEVYPDARFELFEPLAGRYNDYQPFIEERLRAHPNFRLHPFALGAASGEAEFWLHTKGVGSSLLAEGFPKDECIRVPVVRLDDVMKSLALPQPQVIKMDVQGGEGLIIEGGRNTIAAADVLHLETWISSAYHGKTPLLTEIIEQVRPLGFTLVQLGSFWRNPRTQEIQSVDVFFAHARLIQRFEEAGAGFPWPAKYEG